MKKIITLFALFLSVLQMPFAQTAPDFNITDIHGGEHNLYTALNNGYIVMLDFFFVDCGPCQLSAPEIKAIHEDYSGKNVVVISVSDHSEDTNLYIEQFDEQHDYTWYSAGPQGGGVQVIDTYADQFTFTGYPTISIICPNKSINWDIWPYSAGAPQWRNAIDACGVVDAPPYQPLNTNVLDVDRQFSGLSLFPNPVGESATLNFGLTSPQEVKAEIFNMMGQQSGNQILFNGQQGNNKVVMNTTDLVSGTYMIRLTTASGEVSNIAMIRQ
jgi:thiol-disulfide isomerase/thioredoxin